MANGESRYKLHASRCKQIQLKKSPGLKFEVPETGDW
jgi:hypothetical protein